MALKYFIFVWRIENFSYYWQKSDSVCIISPAFQVNYANGTAKRELLITDRPFFHGFGPISKNDKCFILHIRKPDFIGGDQLTVSAFLVKDDKSLIYSVERLEKGRYTELIKITASDIRSKHDELYPRDVLTIRCKIESRDSKFEILEEQCLVRTLLTLQRMNFIAVVEEFGDLIPGLKRTVRIKSASVDQPIFSMIVCLSDEGQLKISIPVETNNIKFCFCKVLVFQNSGNWLQCGKDSEWRKFGEVCEFPLTLDFKTLMDKQTYVQKDVLTLRCEVTYSTEVIPQEFHTINYGLESLENSQQTNACVKIPPAPETENGGLQSPSTLTEDLVSLYQEQILSDTKIRTETETFPAHKVVLSARSPVFKKMFTTDMKESTKDYVDIQDLKADTVRKMLVFMYTDTVELMNWQNAKELYFAADKYEVVSLKLKCSSFLKLNIRPSNCCEVLLLSDMHQDSDLKRFVQNYIITHDQDVFGSEEWRNFVASHVQLAADTMCLKYARK